MRRAQQGPEYAAGMDFCEVWGQSADGERVWLCLIPDSGGVYRIPEALMEGAVVSLGFHGESRDFRRVSGHAGESPGVLAGTGRI